LEDFVETPAEWRNDELAAKWASVRAARRVVTAALEVQRTEKVIGASLEAAPTVYVADADLRAALESVPFDDIAITSAITVSGDAAPEGAFTLPEIEGVAVSFAKADGEKCQRCWKILPDVGAHKQTGVCGRCSDALVG
ncbi:zinc finger domain-containing protein, partial [Planktotalea sp.]|uniref:zinc finger domain-containing protein n=1 Tax=Planktotalea sp. TaxID=2029877 RepID=UPI00329971C1